LKIPRQQGETITDDDFHMSSAWAGFGSCANQAARATRTVASRRKRILVFITVPWMMTPPLTSCAAPTSDGGQLPVLMVGTS
jgi:hypothetical protein